MRRYAKVDFTGPATSCLATISWPVTSPVNSKDLYVVKIEDENGKLNYVSVSGSTVKADNSVIKLNGKFGQLLGLKDGQTVVVTPVEHKLPSIESIDVKCESADDWEILEANAEALTNKLLNQLRVVYPGLRCPIWVSRSLSIHLCVEKLKPQVEVGVLESFSEVVIPSISQPKSVPFNLNFAPQLRLHPLTILPHLHLNSNTFLLMSNIDHAFVYRSSLMRQDYQNSLESDEENVSFSAKIIYDFESGAEDIRLPVVKIYFIEYIVKKDIELNHIFPHLNPPAIFVHPKLIQEFNLAPKSHICIEQVSNDVFAQNIPRYSPLSSTTRSLQESSTYSRIFQKLFDDAHLFLTASLGVTSLQHGVHGPASGLMLVTGKEGSGKTTFVRSLAIKFEGFPFHLHWEEISCAKLRGKKTETLQKEFDAVAKRASDFYPAIIILDDLDIICPPLMTEQHNPQEEFLHYRTCETIFECIMSLTGKQIAVICTARAESSLHLYWRSREASHVFQHCVHLPAPNPLERLGIFRACLRRYQSRPETVTTSLGRPTASSFPTQLNSMMTSTAAVSQVGFSQGNDNSLAVPLMTKSCSSPPQEIHLTDSMQNALCNLHDNVCTPNAIHSIAKKWALFENRSCHHTPEDKDDFFNEIIHAELGLRDVSSKSKAIKPITWDRIGGLANVKNELTKILQWPIRYSKLFDKSPIKMPSGILLYGFPGTGKTLLGLSMTSLVTNTKFIHIKGPELLSKYIGASEQAVQDLFRKAKDSSPCILFFDEFDSLVPRRGHDSTGVTDRVVNQFLAEMDGIEGGLGKGVYLIGATSRPDLIDPAVLRPGRLDKHLFFPMPDKGERVEIISALSGDVQYSDSDGEIRWDEIGRETGGFTGADLHSLLCTAQLEAIQESLAHILSGAAPEAEGTTTENLDLLEGTSKILVTQKHILNALRTFKPSLPAEEFNKFKTIYNNFSTLTKGGGGGGEMNDSGVDSVLIEHGKIATLA